MSAALDADADANADALTTALLASAGVDRASRRGRPSRARALNQQDDSELFLEHDPLLEDSSTSGEDARDDEDGRENDEDVERASSLASSPLVDESSSSGSCSRKSSESSC